MTTNFTDAPTFGMLEGLTPPDDLPALSPVASKLRRLRMKECLPDGSSARHHELESLWFELNDPSIRSIGLVPVPPWIGQDRGKLVAEQFGAIGASVSRRSVAVIDAFGVTPAESELAVRDLRTVVDAMPLAIVITQAPTRDPGSLPLLEACDRVVLLVGLGVSKRRELERLQEMLDRVELVGAVTIPVRGRKNASVTRQKTDRRQPKVTVDNSSLGSAQSNESSSS